VSIDVSRLFRGLCMYSNCMEWMGSSVTGEALFPTRRQMTYHSIERSSQHRKAPAGELNR
jgi:hypothetical protein